MIKKTIFLDNLNSSTGLTITANPLNSGFGVISNAGDLDGNGYDDLIIGQPYFVNGRDYNLGKVFLTYLPLDISSKNYNLSNNLNSSSVSFYRERIDNMKAGLYQSGIGDINGDGLEEFIYSLESSSNILPSFIFLGNATRLTNPQEIYNQYGSDSFMVYPSSGYTLIKNFYIGDVNGDNYDDFISIQKSISKSIIFARITFGNPKFKSELISINLSNENGFGIFCDEGVYDLQNCVDEVKHAGDFNNDGFDDFLITYQRSDSKSFVSLIYGNETFSDYIVLNDIDSNQGFVINPNEKFGIIANNDFNMAGGGDINNDGFDDIVLSYVAKFHECVFVIFGGKKFNSTEFDLNKIDGNNGFYTCQNNAKIYLNNFGSKISIPGDINNDSYDDILIMTDSKNCIFNPNYIMQHYVIYGRNNFDTNFNVNNINEKEGFYIRARESMQDCDSYVHKTVDRPIDINCDGINDLVFGVYNKFFKTVEKHINGEVFVLYGSDSSPVNVSPSPIASSSSSPDVSITASVLSSPSVSVTPSSGPNNEIPKNTIEKYEIPLISSFVVVGFFTFGVGVFMRYKNYFDIFNYRQVDESGSNLEMRLVDLQGETDESGGISTYQWYIKIINNFFASYLLFNVYKTLIVNSSKTFFIVFYK